MGILKDKALAGGKTVINTKAILSRAISRGKVRLCAKKGAGATQENGSAVR